MNVKINSIHGVQLFTPMNFQDTRGLFFESYNKKFLHHAGINYDFVQENTSFSHKHVIRGLHFQYRFPQGKLITLLAGSILDVVVDLRLQSSTFKQTLLVYLNTVSQQIWIPPGLAHGFKVLSDYAIISYKVTEYWHPEDEHIILWNDPELAIDWQLCAVPILSQKDRNGLPFSKIPKFTSY